VDGANLGFWDAVRAPKVELYCGGLALAALQVLKRCIDFLL
jgi:hypothetical protein